MLYDCGSWILALGSQRCQRVISVVRDSVDDLMTLIVPCAFLEGSVGRSGQDGAQ